MSGKNGRKRGRPTDYTEEKAEKIIDRISAGESLVHICKDTDLPHRRTVIRWRADEKYEEFARQYKFAREVGGDAIADEIKTLADGLADSNNADSRDQILAKKTALDNYRWLAGKLNPEKYGDQVKVSGNIKHDHTHTVDLRAAILKSKEMERRLDEKRLGLDTPDIVDVTPDEPTSDALPIGQEGTAQEVDGAQSVEPTPPSTLPSP